MSSTARVLDGATADPRPDGVSWKNAAFLTLEALHEAHLLEGSLVVLIGSFARGASTWKSDVDIVVITKRIPRERPDAPSIVELHFIDPADLRQRILGGDDFAQWIVRNGRLLHGPTADWLRFQDALDRAPWPRGDRKLEPARRHLARSVDLLEMGDLDASTDQGLRAADMLARRILLSARLWPLSRPELPSQLRSSGEHELAEALEVLGARDITKHGLESALETVKKRASQEATDVD